MPRLRDATGQASVEFVAMLPLVALVAGGLWQAVVAGQAVWASAGAAPPAGPAGGGGGAAGGGGGGGAAARGEAIGDDAAAGARATLPVSLRRGLRVDADHSGVRVDLSIPLVFTGGHLATVSARAALPSQRGGAVGSAAKRASSSWRSCRCSRRSRSPPGRLSPRARRGPSRATRPRPGAWRSSRAAPPPPRRVTRCPGGRATGWTSASTALSFASPCARRRCFR